MNKLFFQVKLLLSLSITTILLVLGSCSDSSSSKDVSPGGPSIPGFSYAAISGTIGVALDEVIPTLPEGITGEGTFADTGGLVAATGLNFDTRTGAISGTPSKAITTAREFIVTYTPPKEHEANYGNTRIEVSIIIAKGTLNVSYDPISGRVDEDLLAASPTLPEGITGGTFADTDDLAIATGLNFDTRTGAISGTPDAAVTTARKFTVIYTPPKEHEASYGNTRIEVSIIIAKGTLNVSYDPISGRVDEDLLAASPTLPEGITGGTFADTDDLEITEATGLELNTNTGEISGTPDAAVTRKFIVTYTPSEYHQADYGNTRIEVSITIAKGTIGVKYAAISGRVGEVLSTVKPSFFQHRYRYILVEGTFADTDNLAIATGLELNTNTGEISGTPDAAVTRKFIVTYTPSEYHQADYGNTPIEVSITIVK